MATEQYVNNALNNQVLGRIMRNGAGAARGVPDIVGMSRHGCFKQDTINSPVVPITRAEFDKLMAAGARK